MPDPYTDAELEQMMREANTRSESGRIRRLRVMLSKQDFHPAYYDWLSYQYAEEARLCWYVGTFVAAIVMAQLAFEEMFRAYYREARGVGGNLNKGVKLDHAGFADLITQACADGLISAEEGEALDRLRKELRNPYVHPHDVSKDNDPSKPSFLTQLFKIVAPELNKGNVEADAQDAITTLAASFPGISGRLFYKC